MRYNAKQCIGYERRSNLKAEQEEKLIVQSESMVACRRMFQHILLCTVGKRMSILIVSRKYMTIFLSGSIHAHARGLNSIGDHACAENSSEPKAGTKFQCAHNEQRADHFLLATTPSFLPFSDQTPVAVLLVATEPSASPPFPSPWRGPPQTFLNILSTVTCRRMEIEEKHRHCWPKPS
jgi:hypothetical protein